jgi:pyrimidine operon attenuation protein/uracil phosphoribosyltransferase
LAYRLRDEISKKDEQKPPTGVLDINLYRDDWTRIGPNPKLRSTEISFSIDDKIIILVDDVLFTGRTVRASRRCTFYRQDSEGSYGCIDRFR